MSCKFGCPTKVKTALNGIDGVKLCDVNYETSTATVTYNDEDINGKDIVKILSDKTDFEILIENEPKEEPSSFKKFFSKFFISYISFVEVKPFIVPDLYPAVLFPHTLL